MKTRVETYIIYWIILYKDKDCKAWIKYLYRYRSICLAQPCENSPAFKGGGGGG